MSRIRTISEKEDRAYPVGKRTVPEAARKAMYAAFREHADEVREVLVSILRDETADKGHRIQAGKEILNRGFGQAPSIDIIEASFRHDHTFSPEVLRQFPPQKLAALEAMLAELIVVPESEVIDHEP
jgi:hypothetical protein